jgi:hypothetical protein
VIRRLLTPARRTQLRAAATSAGRVFLGGVVVAFLSSGESVSALDVDDLVLLLDAGAGALVVTVGNALRAGETRFGRGAELERT